MLYSDSPEDTADLVGMLQKKEAAKGHAFPSPLDIGDRERRVLPLYQVRSSYVEFLNVLNLGEDDDDQKRQKKLVHV